jgi:hypothetical protein
MRLDADDWLLPGAINALYNKIAQDDSFGMVYGNYSEYYESDGTYRDVRLKEGFSAKMVDSFCHGAGMMFRKSCLIKTGGYDSKFKKDDGLQIQLKIGSEFEVAHINQTIFSYRQHRAQKTYDKAERNAERVRLLEYLSLKLRPRKHFVLGFSNQSGGDSSSRAVIEALASRIANAKTADVKVVYSNISHQQATELAGKYPDINFRGRQSHADLDIYNLAIAAVKGKAENDDVISIVTDDYPNERVRYLDLSYFYFKFSDVELVLSGRLFSNVVYNSDGAGGIQLYGSGTEKNKREPVFLRCGGITTCSALALESGRLNLASFLGRAAFFEVDEISSMQTLIQNHLE